MIPYWEDSGQVCLIATETRRKDGAARPVVSTSVPLFESMDPNARALPLWKPRQFGREGELGSDQNDLGDRRLEPNIDSSWLAGARANGLQGSDAEIAETLFYAICGIAASPQWLATQPTEFDDYATLPVPSDPGLLVAASATGREFAALIDPWTDVVGITSPPLDEAVQGIAVADSPQHGDPTLVYGRPGQLGGKIDGTSLLWSEDEGWRNIPPDVLDFRLGGYRAIEKHLAYYKDKPLTYEQREQVTTMARRIVAILALAPKADDHFAAAKAFALEPLQRS